MTLLTTEIIKSEKNTDLLVLNENIFRKNKIYNNVQYWTCNTANYKGSGMFDLDYHSSLGSFVLKKPHTNHESPVQHIIYLKKIYEIKSIITKNPLASTRTTIADALSEPYSTIEAMGNPENISRLLRAAKESTLNSKPYYNQELKLSFRLCFTVRNENFYKYGQEIFLTYLCMTT